MTTIAERQRRLRENLESLPAKAVEWKALNAQIEDDERALAEWAKAQREKAEAPTEAVTPITVQAALDAMTPESAADVLQ